MFVHMICGTWNTALVSVALASLLFSFGALHGQTLDLVTLAPLPSSLLESSGLFPHSDGTFWSHEDSGNAAQLVRIDTLGQVIQILAIDAENTDWEELTSDVYGNLYVGDFGNNANSRIDLQVLRVNEEYLAGQGTSQVDVIHFSYGDQIGFPPPSADRHFDMEAMVWWNDTLHLFSKDRTSPYMGICKRYKLPAFPGNYVIFPVDTFYTGQTNNIFSVTGAALSVDGARLVLINANSIWMFTDFIGTDFFSGTVQQLQLGSITQKEAVCFKGDLLYITDERSPLSDGHLHRVNPSLFVGLEDKLSRSHFINAIYATDGRFESLRWEEGGAEKWLLFTADGVKIADGSLESGAKALSTEHMPTLNGLAVFHLIFKDGSKSALLFAMH